jgi:hypothetical protein
MDTIKKMTTRILLVELALGSSHRIFNRYYYLLRLVLPGITDDESHSDDNDDNNIMIK